MRRNSTLSIFIMAVSLIVAIPPQSRAQTNVQNDPARALFLEGRNLWDDGKFGEAEKKFREALERFPKADQSDRTAYYLITTLVKQGRTTDARAEIDNFYKNYPHSSWKSDVEEMRIPLRTVIFSVKTPFANHKVAIPSPPQPIYTPWNNFHNGQPAPWSTNSHIVTRPNPALESEILRLIIVTDSHRGIEVSRERLKTDPTDPVVVSNLGVIANSGSAQALPFLRNLAGSSTVPKIRSQAIFFMSRGNGDKEAAAKALTEMLADSKDKETDAAIAEAFTNFNVAVRREAFSKITDVSMLERIYRNSENSTLRTSVIQAAGQIPDARGVAFLSEVARSDGDLNVRRAAVQTLASWKDVRPLENLLRSLPAADRRK